MAVALEKVIRTTKGLFGVTINSGRVGLSEPTPDSLVLPCNGEDKAGVLEMAKQRVLRNLEKHKYVQFGSSRYLGRNLFVLAYNSYTRG